MGAHQLFFRASQLLPKLSLNKILGLRFVSDEISVSGIAKQIQDCYYYNGQEMPIQFWAPSCFVIRKLHATTQRKLNSNIPLKLWIVRLDLEVGGPCSVQYFSVRSDL